MDFREILGAQSEKCLNSKEVFICEDVYGKRQKWNFLPSFLSCVYRGLKLFVFAMNSKRRFPIFVCFIYGLEQ